MWTYRAEVIRVIDGDTIVVDIDLGFETWIRGQSIRLANIDTPEVRTKDLREKAAGNLSRDRVIELIENKDITINTIKDKTEKFGRMLGIIFNHQGININETLLLERLAVEYNGQSKQLILERQNQNIEYLISIGKLLIS
jgi:micrococcal nuclease